MPERLSYPENLREPSRWWLKPLTGAVLLITALGALTMTNDGWEPPVGSGVVGCEHRQLPEFDGVEACGSIDVQLFQGAETSVKVEGGENLLGYVTTEVHRGVLRVGTRRARFTAKTPLVVKVTLPHLRSLEVSGSGSLLGQSALQSESVLLRVSGSGELTVNGQFSNVVAELSGSGDLTASGRTENLDIDLEGAGALQAQALRVDGACHVDLGGSGDCFVWSEGSLRVYLDGSGSVRYRGQAAHISSEIEGSGNLGVMEEERSWL